MCTTFGVDSSSRFPFRARTDTQTHTVTDATDHPNYGSATVDMGNNVDCCDVTYLLILQL